MQLRHAKRIDFTDGLNGFEHFESFGQSVIDFLRTKGREPVVIIVDRGYGFTAEHTEPHVVVDHINVSGDNPLVGPNDSIGQRFPVVNNIYIAGADTMDQAETWSIDNPLAKMRNGVVAGVKPGLQLDAEALATCNQLGAQFYCYNLVPAMIVAAHAGLTVLGLVVPAGQKLNKNALAAISG